MTNLSQKFKKNRNEIIEAANELEGLIPGVKEYLEAKAAFERINTLEMQSRFAQLDAITEKQNRIKKLKEEITSLKEKIDIESIKKEFQNIVQEVKKDSNEELKKWAEEFLNKIFESEKGKDVRDSITELLERLEDSLVKILEKVEGEETELSKTAEDLKAQLSTIDDLDIEVVTVVEKRNAYKRRYDSLKVKKENIKKKREAIEDLFSQRHLLLEEFIKFQEAKSEKRKEKKDEVNDKLEKNIRSKTSVRIDFRPLGSREVFEDRLGTKREGKKRDEGILKGVGPKYMDRRFAETISMHMTPKEFAEIIMDSNVNGLILNHSDGENSIDTNDARKIINHLFPTVELYGEKYYDPEKLQVLLKLEEIEYEDLPEIKLSNDPIMGLSPGQRCSALVPIILLQGECPLIIDQPEDNLDNKLVFDLVVDILRSLKEFRQIIVATHNPNIHVSGDAEQIILFESIDKNTGKAEHQGSIDNEIIINKVKEVMEGGDIAFHTRAQKYRYTPFLGK